MNTANVVNNSARRFSLSSAIGATVAALVLVGAPAAPVQASTATGTVVISATVLAVCTITGTTMALGNYNPGVVTATQVTSANSLSALCTLGTPAQISIGTGNNTTHAVGTTRALAFGTSYLSYELYFDSPGGTVWGTTAGHTLSYTGTGLPTTVNMYAQIPAGQTTPIVGAYTDTVTATITY